MKCKIELEIDVEMKDEKNIQEYSDLLKIANDGVINAMTRTGRKVDSLERELIAENGNVAKTIKVEIPNKEENHVVKYYKAKQKVRQLERKLIGSVYRNEILVKNRNTIYDPKLTDEDISAMHQRQIEYYIDKCNRLELELSKYTIPIESIIDDNDSPVQQRCTPFTRRWNAEDLGCTPPDYRKKR